MCTYSMVIQDHTLRHPNLWNVSYQYNTGADWQARADIAAMKAELESLKKLLKAAKIYDEETGQPDCGMKDKIETLKKMGELLGVDMKECL